MIVRELLARFGFQVDTAAIDRWNRAAEHGKAMAGQMTAAATPAAAALAETGAAAMTAASGVAHVATEMARVVPAAQAAAAAAGELSLAEGQAGRHGASQQDRFAAAVSRSRQAMLAASATAAASAATLANVFAVVPEELRAIDVRSQALGRDFDALKAKAEALGRAIHAATAAGATMADPRLAGLAAAYADVSREIDEANRRARRARMGAMDANSVYSVLKQTLVGVAASAVAMFGALAVGNAVRDYADWEGSLNSLRAVSGAAGKEFEAMREKALKLGVDTVFSTKEATDGMVELARAGMDTKEVMASIDGTLNLAAAGQISVARAAEVTSDTLNMFALKAGESGRIADIMAVAANASSISVNQLAESMSYAGAVGHGYGQTVEDVAAAIAILGNAGIKGSSAGTGLAAMMNRLAAPSSKDAVKYIAQLGLNVKDAHGNMKPLPDLLAQLQKGLKGMGNVQRGMIIKEIFGEEAMKDITSFLGMAPSKIKATTDAIYKNHGEAARLSKILNQGLGKAWAELLSTLDAFSKRVLLSVSPGLEDMIRGFTASVQQIGEWVDAAAKAARAGSGLADSLRWVKLAFVLLAPGLLIAALRTLGPVIYANLVVPVLAAARAGLAWTAANAGLILLTAGVVLLGLVVQDLYTWLNGGDAALGNVFQESYDRGAAFSQLLMDMGGSWESMYGIAAGGFEVVRAIFPQWADAYYTIGYSMVEAFEQGTAALSALFAERTAEYYGQWYDFGGRVMAWMMATWESAGTAVANFVTRSDAYVQSLVAQAQAALAEIPLVADAAFSGLYNAVVTWIDLAKGKVAELASSLADATSSIPGLGQLTASVAQAVQVSAAPGPTPAGTAAARAGTTVHAPSSQSVTNNVTVNPPPGATHPAAYGTAAGSASGDATRKALARGARSVPRIVR